MDETTLFLTRVFGLYLSIVGVLLLFAKERVGERITQLLESPETRFFSAVVTLMIGILLIVSHNVWTMNWVVLITILSWWVLVKGLLRLFVPEIDRHWTHGFLQNRVYYPVAVPRGTGNLDQKVSLMGLFPLPLRTLPALPSTLIGIVTLSIGVTQGSRSHHGVIRR